jgi:peptidoglycan hydrolase-like protein with peptidoglycan-binding domain
MRKPAERHAASAKGGEARPVDQVLRLQRTVGNRAVHAFLGRRYVQRRSAGQGQIQRDPDGAVADPPVTVLSADQVRAAQAFYNSHPDRYTLGFIQQIQQVVGVGTDGVMGPETIQAVAAWQQGQSGLDVDGQAGPRTLPVMFPVGLAKDTAVEDFAADAKAVENQWATLGNAQARGRALLEAVNAQLTASQTPACLMALQDLGNDAGQFDFATWTLALGQTPFSADSVTGEEAADMANTVYHESRHAQQWFLMARMLAGQRQTASQIATGMGIPANIAAQAVANPAAPGSTEAVEAAGFYESVYGGHAAARNQTLDDVEKLDTKQKAARQAFEDDPTPLNQARLAAAKAAFEEAYARYRNLPEEADAWRQGDAVTAAYGRL